MTKQINPMNIAVIGAGNGGLSTFIEMTLQGHTAVLYGRSSATIGPLRKGIIYEGVLGSGQIKEPQVTTNLAEALKNADLVIISLPTFAHYEVAQSLAKAGWPADKPIILNPGHTGGVFEFSQAFRKTNGKNPLVAEFSTLAYVARKHGGNNINITGRAGRLRAAALPEARSVVDLAGDLFPGVYDSGDVLATGLANVNMVLHTPGAILSASWVEAKQGDYTFYVEGMTPGTARIMRQLDQERLAVAKAFGHDLPVLIDEMRDLGTVEKDASVDDYAKAVASGEANRLIRGPDSFEHRYYVEDFNYGLTPFLCLAQIAGISTPVAQSLSQLGSLLIDKKHASRDAKSMGLVGINKAELINLVK